MKIEEIRGIAKQRDVKTGKMKKSEIIRAIQEAEGNPVCFDTGKTVECGQVNCLWREDCK
jgi:Rho termination factor, N-terminal domain